MEILEHAYVVYLEKGVTITSSSVMKYISYKTKIFISKPEPYFPELKSIVLS
jgi:hypothetical protein